MSLNQLAQETSPYLLAHKDNPVHWWPWGEEALTEAKKTNKPILISIGYAACHWCHVMADESFADDETAALMNEKFINIKIFIIGNLFLFLLWIFGVIYKGFK